MKNPIKIFGAICILSIVIFFQACDGDQQMKNDKTADTPTMMHNSQMTDSTATTYACPMHKNITGKKGDKCSECGMDMKEMNYSCPMHKDKMGMAGDKCSECGMDMKEMTYCCPMHKNKMGMAGDKCSACGMDMKEMEGMNHEMHK